MNQCYSMFKSKIRNKITKQHKNELVPLLFKKYFSSTIQTEQKNDLNPWEYAALLKWAMKYGNINKHETKPCIQTGLDELKQNTRDFWLACDKEDQPDSIRQYFKKYRHQQVIYGEDTKTLLKLSLTRDYLIFKDNAEVNKVFHEKFNVNPLAPYHAVFGLFTLLQDNTELILSENFQILFDVFSIEFIGNFLDRFSNTESALKNKWELEKNHDPCNDLTNPTPFIDSPLLKLEDGKYRVLNNAVISFRISTFIYDFLNTHMKHFSTFYGDNIFQPYVKHLYEYYQILGFKPIKEGTDKSCDFIYQKDGQNIFIEVKSGGLNDIAKFAIQDSVVYRTLKKSILKGISQITKTTESYNATNTDYGLIITSSETCLDFFVQETNLTEVTDLFKNTQLTKENVFIISISSFEKMLDLASSESRPFHDVFSEILSLYKEDTNKYLALYGYILDRHGDIPRIISEGCSKLLSRLDRNPDQSDSPPDAS